MIEYTHLTTPLGELLAVSRQEALIGLYFADQRHAPAISTDWSRCPSSKLFVALEAQLREFAGGTRISFDLPLCPSGTDFQRAIWAVIQTIPFGSTLSYSELVARVGRPHAIRAAGAATGANPISWIIPCHRVIGKTGKMTGYAGGLSRKIALLEFEAAKLAPGPCKLG
jgi:methylated-DNA-[protein]-cysteine S-methyltransferase